MGLPVLLIRRRYRPYGYCPGCGHRINPGICVECGREVPPERLIRSRRVAHRWSRWRRKLLLGAACLIVGAALVVYHQYGVLTFIPSPLLMSAPVGLRDRVQPELIKRYSNGRLSLDQGAVLLQRLPTSELLKLQQGSIGAAGETLWNRYLAGQLTQSAANQMLRNAISLPQDLGLDPIVQNEWGSPTEAQVPVNCTLPLPEGWQLVVDDCQQSTDGQPAMQVLEVIGPQSTPAIFRFGWHQLDPGERLLTVEFRFSLSPPAGAPSKLPRIRCGRAVAQKIIVVEEGAQTAPASPPSWRP